MQNTQPRPRVCCAARAPASLPPLLIGIAPWRAGLGPLGAHVHGKVAHGQPGEDLFRERALHELFLGKAARRLWIE